MFSVQENNMKIARTVIMILIGLCPCGCTLTPICGAVAPPMGTSCVAYPEPRSPRSVVPEVESTTINFNENVVIIRGHNFGSSLPDVRLAQHVLKVKRFSAGEITASLPPGIRPATYYNLTITAHDPHKGSSSESTTTTLFAAE